MGIIILLVILAAVVLLLTWSIRIIVQTEREIESLQESQRALGEILETLVVRQREILTDLRFRSRLHE